MPTDEEFSAYEGTRISNTLDGNTPPRITKKSYEVHDGSDYVAVWEVVYTYDGTNLNYDDATGQEPTT